MFRLVYEEPLNELLISDGINLYRYDKDLEQVQIQSLKELPKEIEMGITNNLLRFLRYEDILGQIVSFQFTNISNKKLDKNLFTFSSPPGFDIIHYESYKD